MKLKSMNDSLQEFDGEDKIFFTGVHFFSLCQRVF